MVYPYHVPGIPLPYALALLGLNLLHQLVHIFDGVERASPFTPYRRLNKWHSGSVAALAVSDSISLTWDSVPPPDLRLLAFFTSCSSFQKKEACYRRKLTKLKNFNITQFDYAEEVSLDSAAFIVLGESFDFLDRLLGPCWMGQLLRPTHTQYPDFYWFAAVQPACSKFYVYRKVMDMKGSIAPEIHKTRAFIKALVNSEIPELGYMYPKKFNCPDYAPMRQSQCPHWYDP